MKRIGTVAALVAVMAAPAFAQDAKPAVTPPMAPAAKPAETPKAQPIAGKEVATQPAAKATDTKVDPKASVGTDAKKADPKAAAPATAPTVPAAAPVQPKADAAKGEAKTTEKPAETKKQ